jgi:chorismate mutase
MSQSPPAPPSLAELRKEIDAIDEGMHRLLMQRGDIIDRLIQVKQTQEVGSAFRPAREADMMRRLVERHRGILPLDTVESIWRVIISTFTYVQAPFSVHADVSVNESAMRDSARFHFGFTVPYVAHFNASAAVEAVARSKGDLALVSAISSRTPWWLALEADGAPKITARLPFVARRRQRHGDRGRDLERAGLGVERRDRAGAVAARRRRRRAGYRLRRRRALDVDPRRQGTRKGTGKGAGQDHPGPGCGRCLGALFGSRRQPRNALYGAG